jgi:hypothetical protein
VKFGDVEFRLVDHASIDVHGLRVVWAPSGRPAVLDPAAATLLDCFGEPTTSDLIAQDLVDVIGLGRDEARRAAATTTHLLRNAGVIVATNQEVAQPWRYHYPPSASP